MGMGQRGQEMTPKEPRAQHKGGQMTPSLPTPCAQSAFVESSGTAEQWMSLPPPHQGSPPPTLSRKDVTDSLPGPKKDSGHFSEMKIIVLD